MMSSFEKEPSIQLKAKQVKKIPSLSLTYMKAPHGVVLCIIAETDAVSVWSNRKGNDPPKSTQ